MRSFVPLLLLASFLPSLSFAQGRRVAVFVGVSQYSVPSSSPDKGGYSSLRYAHKDAERLGDAFRSLGWETKVLRAPPGATASDATKVGILESVRSLRLDADDTLLFFFSGHGNRLDGKDYLVPFDAEWSGGRPDASTLLSFDELQSAFETLGAGARILMVDACRDAPGAKSGGNNALDPSQVSAKMGQVVRASRSGAVSWVTMLSCGPGQVSYEEETLAGGVFATAILKALDSSESADARGNIRPELMMDTVRENVRDWAQANGKSLEPSLASSIASRPIYLGSKLETIVIVGGPPNLPLGKVNHTKIKTALDLQMEEVRSRGIYPTDREVAGEIERLKGFDAGYVAAWTSSPEAEKNFRDYIQYKVALIKLQTMGISITDQEVNRFFSDVLSLYAKGATYKLRMIVVRNRDEAREVDKQLELGTDFAQVARERSMDVSTLLDGDLGLVFVDLLAEEERSAILATAVGRTTGWIQRSQEPPLRKYLIVSVTPGKLELTPIMQAMIRRKLMLDRGREKRAQGSSPNSECQIAALVLVHLNFYSL